MEKAYSSTVERGEPGRLIARRGVEGGEVDMLLTESWPTSFPRTAGAFAHRRRVP